MNLIEAIASCRPFRRKGTHTVWLVELDSDSLNDLNETEAVYLRSVDEERISLLAVDLLAGDWEVKEAEVVITRSQFWEAHVRALTVLGQPSGGPVESRVDLASQLAIELGLET